MLKIYVTQRNIAKQVQNLQHKNFTKEKFGKCDVYNHISSTRDCCRGNFPRAYCAIAASTLSYQSN